jgi:hypothetical protein
MNANETGPTNGKALNDRPANTSRPPGYKRSLSCKWFLSVVGHGYVSVKQGKHHWLGSALP